MAFIVPDELLAQLRARRAEQRAGHEQAASQSPASAGNFIDSLRDLFSGRIDVHGAAESYVGAMSQWQAEIEDAEDAFLLDPGMGPMVYLTADGRVLRDHRGWDGAEVEEVGGDEAIAAILVGAKKTGIDALLQLVPPAPPGSVQCSNCRGSRWAEPVAGFGVEWPCRLCGGRGWAMDGDS